MKLTNLATALFLLSTTACGAVVEPTDDTTGDDSTTPDTHGGQLPINGDGEEPPMVTPPVLRIDAPMAATTMGSLFSMGFDNGSPIENVVVQEERTRIDIVEQTITTVRAEEIHLVVELAPPTGTYARTLVSDALKVGGTHADRVLCESNNIATYDPRCEAVTPAPRDMASAGAITTSKWKLTVLDAVTGVALGGCLDAGVNKVTCALPARADASYRVIASAHGFANLWDGNTSSGFGPFALAGQSFVGGFGPPEWQCWNFPTSGSSVYCGARYEFYRFTALDRARLEFDPITIRITANGSTTALATPALIWDAGNDDVPGSTY